MKLPKLLLMLLVAGLQPAAFLTSAQSLAHPNVDMDHQVDHQVDHQELDMAITHAGNEISPVPAVSILSDSTRTEQPDWLRIEIRNGTRLIGILLQEDDTSITLDVEGLGTITIPKSTIIRRELLPKDYRKDGTHWFENPQSTRYFFAPNALSLEKKRGYYQNIWVLFNNVNYGVTERFSIGGGLVPLFLFGSPVTPVWILPKVTIPINKERIYVGAGAMLGGIVGEDNEGLGLLYGLGTYGDRNRNVTVGVGYGYAGDDISNTPLINISGMWRSGPRITWLTENYFLTGEGVAGLISVGARWTYEQFAVDFGLVRPVGEDTEGVIGVPWLGVTMPFSRK